MLRQLGCGNRHGADGPGHRSNPGPAGPRKVVGVCLAHSHR